VGNVVSIMGAIGKRRADEARALAATTHLRQLESMATLAEVEAQLETMDLDGGIAELEKETSDEARTNRAMLRALRAFRACKRGDVDAGLAEWETAIAEAPTVASPYLIRAYWWTRKDPARALPDYDRAIQLSPKDANAYARRGDCLGALGDEERALANYRRALTLDPKLFDVHFTLATVLAKRGDHEHALSSYDRAIRLAPKYVEFYLGRAATWEALGKLDRAIADLDRVLELDPKREEVRAHRFDVLCKNGEAARAVNETAKRLEGALANDPDSLTMLGSMFLSTGQRPEAIERLSRALALAPDHVTALAHRARAYFDLGDNERAFQDYDRAATLAPGEAKHHEGRSNSLARMGRYAEAVESMTRAIELAPDHAASHALRGIYRSHTEPDDDEGAARVKADLYRAIELAPKEIVYVRKLGEFLTDRWELAEALALFDKAIERIPNKGELYYQRGYCKSQLPQELFERDLGDDTETDEETERRCKDAIVDLEKAIALGHADEDTYWEIVRCHEQMDIDGEGNATLEALDRALDAHPGDTMMRYFRWDRRRRRGDVEGAASDHAILVEQGFKFPKKGKSKKSEGAEAKAAEANAAEAKPAEAKPAETEG
jgi:tetratricopeptide (TPR) repeat protein